MTATGVAVVAALLIGSVAIGAGDPPAGDSDPTIPTTPTTTPTTPPTTQPTTTTTLPPTTTTRPPTTTTSTTTTTTPRTSTTVPRTGTTVAPSTTVARTTTTTTAPRTAVRCAPPTTTTTTTTTTTLPGTPTTTTTTTTVPGTTTTTTTTTLPPCPTTTTTAPATTTTTTTVPEAPPTALGISAPQELRDILLAIRIVESGQRYEIGPNKGGASGAYQYIDSTWGNYKGYPKAYLAPPHVQDERALAHVVGILDTWAGDVSMVPVIWYYPKAARDPALMDQVPLPHAGNRLTVREYQHRWLDVLAFITGNPSFYAPNAIPPDLKYISGIPPELVADEPVVDAIYDPNTVEPTTPIAFPVLGKTAITPPIPCDFEECEEGTSAVIFGVKMQPVMASVNGVITAVDVGDAASGNVRVTITDKQGRRFVYAGLNDDSPGTDDANAPEWFRTTALARVGQHVYAGQIIGFMGDSDPMPGHTVIAEDESVWPHLRLSIYDADGTRLDADAMVLDAQRRQACHVGIGPWSVPIDPDAVIDEPIDVTTYIAGGWTIHTNATVTAYGQSALIVPPQECVWAPAKPYGPGAAGSQPPQYWGLPFDIDTRYWVADARAQTTLTPRTPLG
ncbi:hypothetical protein BDK89_3621 [Ilumatobacter fluminis]|uniref:Peptidase M23-like protein n=1 Tax=Ilumatobacter fluminis TaxID=467091 RepID=A0A4R7I303_9ACTN|nr:M23 family metallopeptidase [Ilumatobacter fluminis]TDT18007.1 hypothetical protein BDK89_3621 [Ilumatobacter fluminis]